MRLVAALAVLLAAADAHAVDGPCEADTGVGPGEGGRATPERPCAGGELPIAELCHCRVSRDAGQAWGPTRELALEMPKRARVASGEWTDLPFTLRYLGKEPRSLDFGGGSVVYLLRIRRGEREVPRAPCATISLAPPVVRLTLDPGATVTGTIPWKASTYQRDDGCLDLPEDLRPGRYRATFRSVSGDPQLEAEVTITVTPRARRRQRAPR